MAIGAISMCLTFLFLYLFYSLMDSLEQVINETNSNVKVNSEYNEYYPDCDYYVPESEKIINGLDYPQIFEKE